MHFWFRKKVTVPKTVQEAYEMEMRTAKSRLRGTLDWKHVNDTWKIFEALQKTHPNVTWDWFARACRAFNEQPEKERIVPFDHYITGIATGLKQEQISTGWSTFCNLQKTHPNLTWGLFTNAHKTYDGLPPDKRTTPFDKYVIELSEKLEQAQTRQSQTTSGTGGKISTQEAKAVVMSDVAAATFMQISPEDFKTLRISVMRLVPKITNNEIIDLSKAYTALRAKGQAPLDFAKFAADNINAVRRNPAHTK